MWFLSNKCYNGGNRHNFESRYSEVPISEYKFKIEGINPSELRKLMFYKIYEKDVCVWCGKEVKKNGN